MTTETARRMKRKELIQESLWVLMLLVASLPLIIVAAYLTAK